MKNLDVRFWLLTTKSQNVYWDMKFQEGDFLVFGPETRGLPEELLQAHHQRAITVPMRSDNARSLNLASTTQTVFYEAFRQLR